MENRIFLKDYKSPPFSVERILLDIDLDPQKTRVKGTLHITPLTQEKQLTLDGENLTLESVSINGKSVEPKDYTLNNTALILHNVPQSPFILETCVTIEPHKNKSYKGLYYADGMFCTQCEPKGFRNITYALDRPDVLSRFVVRLEGSLKDYPQLLSNGNPINQGLQSHDRHFVVWEDPFPKPTYLFAIVAGAFRCLEDTYITKSGRTITLRFYAKDRIEECKHALDSLKRAMRWDEETFNLEYDLDIFMVASVKIFNMGAMENKGLNIFNDQYVFASPQTASDRDYRFVERIIAHEYFHNWTGNRVTCRDWFQLCLKEGLTVYREQEFARAMGSDALVMLNDIHMLRSKQFPEDQSPLAHPVRPPSFVKIDNFYTATVYEKGAEVVRALKTLLGHRLFLKGFANYIQKNDGTAATVEDFLSAFEEVSGQDLTQFKRWYAQEGTPLVRVEEYFDSDSKTLTLDFTQSLLPAGNRTFDNTPPLCIPISMALFDSQEGRLTLDRTTLLDQGVRVEDGEKTCLVILDQNTKRVVFKNISRKPALSLLRKFSAPVKLESDLTFQDKMTLLKKDNDPFVLSEIMQDVFLSYFQEGVEEQDHAAAPPSAAKLQNILQLFDFYISQFNPSKGHTDKGPGLLSFLLETPSVATLINNLKNPQDPLAIYEKRAHLMRSLAHELKDLISQSYAACMMYIKDATDLRDKHVVELRAFAALLLEYLAYIDGPVLNQASGGALALKHIESAHTFSERLDGLRVLCLRNDPRAQDALSSFHVLAKKQHTTLYKWLSLEAMRPSHDIISRMTSIMNSSDFSQDNPNALRALVDGFMSQNVPGFHAKDGSGYCFVRDVVKEIDKKNYYLSSHFVRGLKNFDKFTSPYRNPIYTILKDLLQLQDISGALREQLETILS